MYRLKKKPETPGRLCLAVDTRYQTNHGRCVTGWRTGSQDTSGHSGFPPLMWAGGGGGRGRVLGLSWAAGGSPRLGFSRWEFQPPMWRNGSRVDQSPFQGCCGRFYWVLGQRLLKETAGDQERRGIAQREVLTAYAWQERATRKSMGRAWGRADQSSREPGHVKCPLPGPQSSHLKNGSRQHD